MEMFKRESLCDQAFKASLFMLKSDREMFQEAIKSLRERDTNEMKIDIYAKDKEINRFEREVRRLMVTHLAVSSNPDINLALILTSIIIDIERIGDFTKNIIELAKAHPQRFHGGECEEILSGVEKTVSDNFDRVITALEQMDIELAREVMGEHVGVAHVVDKLLSDLIENKMLPQESGRAVTCALYVRYLKRISAHLKNIATGLVNPFDRIGFREKKE